MYTLGRSAFLGQSRQSLEAARTLGLTYGAAVRRVALPLARPALGAGVALAVMEALADFGAVNLLGYRALTDAIYRVWYGTFDQAAALQLATVLVGLALTLMTRSSGCCAAAPATTQALGRGDAVIPRGLHGPLRWVAVGRPDGAAGSWSSCCRWCSCSCGPSSRSPTARRAPRSRVRPSTACCSRRSPRSWR